MSVFSNGTAGASNAYDALLLKRNYGRYDLDKQNPKNAVNLNQVDLSNELDFIISLYMSRFKWNTEDFNVSNYYMEYNLFFQGLMVCFKDSKFGWIILPATVTDFNVYGEPTKVTAHGVGYSRTIDYSIDSDKVVLIRDNPACCIPYRLYRRYAGLIADMGRTVEVYSNSMKKPIIFKGNFDKKKSFETAFHNQNNNEFAVYVDTSLIKDSDDQQGEIETWQTDHNGNDLRVLYMHKQSLYSEMMSKMGIDSQLVHKAAQISTDEINKNDLMCELILRQSNECRKEAIAKIIDISGKNITCENIVDISKIEMPDIKNSNNNQDSNKDSNQQSSQK